MKQVLIIFLSIIGLVSRGPRIGVHNDTETKEQEQTKFICGNAVQEQNNALWAEQNLKTKGDSQKGSKLFKQNCAVCHFMNDNKLCGPGLKGVYYRVPQPAEEWLLKFIVNHQKVVDSGDPYAVKIYEEYGKTPSSNFEDVLTEQELKDILVYVISATR